MAEQKRMTKVGFEPTSNGGIAGPKAVAVTTLLLGQTITRYVCEDKYSKNMYLCAIRISLSEQDT